VSRNFSSNVKVYKVLKGLRRLYVEPVRLQCTFENRFQENAGNQGLDTVIATVRILCIQWLVLVCVVLET
jgi:hypothetical protein